MMAQTILLNIMVSVVRSLLLALGILLSMTAFTIVL